MTPVEPLSRSRVTLRIQPDLLDKLQRIALTKQLSVNSLVNGILSREIQKLLTGVTYHASIERREKIAAYVLCCQSGFGPVQIMSMGVYPASKSDDYILFDLRTKHKIEELGLHKNVERQRLRGTACLSPSN